jgi:hypothetical protein
MKSVRYAVYLGIFLHFLRRCLRKSLTQPVEKTKFEFGTSNDRIDTINDMRVARLAEKMKDDIADEIDREIIREMLTGKQPYDIEVTSVRPAPDTLHKIMVDCVVRRQVDYLNLKIDVHRNSLSVCQA